LQKSGAFIAGEDFKMKGKIAIVVALVVVGILAGVATAKEKAEDASLREQLKAQYKLAKLSGVSLDTAEGGTVLTIEKPGILGSSRLLGALNTYRDGVLHAPDKITLALTDSNIESLGQEPIDRRPLPVGDKVYVIRIDASVKREWIQFGIVECNACNGVTEGSPYESTVEFHFPKGYLESASLSQVEDTISQVFAVEGGTQEAQTGQAGQMAEQGQAPAGPALTNDDIIKLVQVNLADSVIIAKIKSSACAFDTSTDGLVRLKQAGVSDAVLQAMFAAGGAAPATEPAPGPTALLAAAGVSALREDCLSLNPATITASEVSGRWKVVDGNHWLFDFGSNATDAGRTADIIKHYRMNQTCFVGRPNPPFKYMLVSGNSPTGAISDEDCVGFNPATTTVSEVSGRWKVVDGNHWLFDFGNSKPGADQTLEIIKKYGFTQSCFVGRPNPGFTYMRK
jgi:hypothetical protein